MDKKALGQGLALVLILGVVAVVGVFMTGTNTPTGYVAAKWYECNDPDAQSQFDKTSLLTKSTTTFSGGEKTDQCYTWNKGKSNEKTRLIEGTCRSTPEGLKFNYWYADCDVAFGKGAKCVDGVCVKSENVDSLDIEAKFVEPLKVEGNEVRAVFTIANIGTTDITTPFTFQVPFCGKNSCVSNIQVPIESLKLGESKIYTLFSTKKYMNENGKIYVKVIADAGNKVAESNENNNKISVKLDNVIIESQACEQTDSMPFLLDYYGTLYGIQQESVKGITTGNWTLDFSKDHKLSLAILGEEVYGVLPTPIYGAVEDYCASQARLMEGYCAIYSQENPTPVATGIFSLCMDGTYCSAGTCKSCNENDCPSCYDSDGGVKELESGDISGLNSDGTMINRRDECINKGGKQISSEVIVGLSAVKEYYCDSNKVTFGQIDCEFGCNSGRCMDKAEAEGWNNN